MCVVSTKGICHRAQHLNLVGLQNKIIFGKLSFSHCLFTKTLQLNFRNSNLDF